MLGLEESGVANESEGHCLPRVPTRIPHLARPLALHYLQLQTRATLRVRVRVRVRVRGMAGIVQSNDMW